jgi:hypothetical protein
MATIKTLAKRLDFTTNPVEEYFTYMVESHLNGNFSQCRALFADLSKADKKEFLSWMKWNNEPGEIQAFYFDLL